MIISLLLERAYIRICGIFHHDRSSFFSKNDLASLPPLLIANFIADRIFFQFLNGFEQILKFVDPSLKGIAEYLREIFVPAPYTPTEVPFFDTIINLIIHIVYYGLIAFIGIIILKKLCSFIRLPCKSISIKKFVNEFVIGNLIYYLFNVLTTKASLITFAILQIPVPALLDKIDPIETPLFLIIYEIFSILFAICVGIRWYDKYIITEDISKGVTVTILAYICIYFF